MAAIDQIVAYMKYTSDNSMYYEKQPTSIDDEYTVDGINDKWKVVKEDAVWTYYYIPYILQPIQGWKIHISTTLDEAQSILERISKTLITYEIPFKHIKSSRALRDMYSKNGNRISSGKFITIYPQGEEFLELIDILEKDLEGFRKGPYILTDKQWKDSNIYFRYGAFKKILSPSGELCLIDADNNLTPDVRKPQYYVPPFVKVPKKLSNADVKPDVCVNKENRLQNYKINNALRFSNSGGIYKGNRIKDGITCIIKEARAEIGFDGANHSAAQRLENEYIALNKLKNIDGIVNVIDYFKVWDNTFLVEEFVEGIELAQWIAKNYPFSLNDDTEGYLKKIIEIMNSLKNIIYLMHKAGVAMCDLQTRNVLIDENLKVTLIDFEIATFPESEELTGMATKGFFHRLNKKAAEKDWYSLNRIMQFCLLPIGAVTDLDMELNRVHCHWIRDNFGKDMYQYFVDYQKECCKHLSNVRDIFKETYSMEDRRNKLTVTHYDIDSIKKGLINGLIENCHVEWNSLINGDIRQFETDCGEFNLLTGGFGAILALKKNNTFPEPLNQWIKHCMDIIFIRDYNDGFLSGRAGIVAALYECGYREQALQLAHLVLNKYNRDSFDLTLRSGLSGIGLMFIALYTETKEMQYLEEAKKIASNITHKMESGKPLTTTDWDSVDVGLSDGFSGISLFYSLLYKVTEDETYIQFSKLLIDKDSENATVSERDGSLQTIDKKKIRLLPYLSNGSIGLGIAISVYHQVKKQNDFQSELDAIMKVAEYRCCYDAGLFDGAGGFFVLVSIAKENDKTNIIQKSIEKLKLLLINKQNNYYVPGKYIFKLSSDMYSGSAGVILALQTSQSKNCLFWLPMLHKIIGKEEN